MFGRVAAFWCIALASLAANDESSRVSRQKLAAMAAHDHELGARLHEQGNYRDAEMLYTRSVERWEKAYGPEHPGLIRLLNTLAALHLDARQLDKAEADTRRALEIQRLAPGVMPAEDEATTLIQLGRV